MQDKDKIEEYLKNISIKVKILQELYFKLGTEKENKLLFVKM